VAWRDDRAGELRLRVRAGEELRVDLALEEMAPVEGRVFDAATGEPLAGARVRFWTFAELDVATSGPDGTFRHPRFPAGNSAHQLRVECDGYGANVRYLTIDERGGWNLFSPTLEGADVGGTGTPWLEIALVPTQRIRGRVLDPTHTPVEGALISAEGFYFVLPEVASPDSASTTSDARGSFVLEGLRSDIGHSVVVSAPALAAQIVEVPGDLQPEWELGTLVLQGEHLLAGTVLDPERHPVEDIAVQLLSLRNWETRRDGLDTGARMLGRVLEARTDPSGTFVFEGLVAGDYRLSVLRDDGVLVSEELSVSDTHETPALLLELPVESRTLLGEVRDAHGTVAGAEVEVRRFGFVARVRTDEAGRFRVAGLDDRASYELCATAFSRESGSPLIAEATAWGSQSTVLRLGERRESR
jgi:protocatechuate 3,4-dioxygenase beta subunit